MKYRCNTQISPLNHPYFLMKKIVKLEYKIKPVHQNLWFYNMLFKMKGVNIKMLKFKKHVKLFVLFVAICSLLFLVACNKETINSKITDKTENADAKSVLETNEENAGDKSEDNAQENSSEADNETSEETNKDSSSEASTKSAEVTQTYRQGRYNENANFNNSGVVAFDSKTKGHLLSSENAVFHFDPISGGITQLFELIEGSAKFLNLTEDWIYYINSASGWVYRVKRDDYSIFETVIEKNCYDLRIEQHCILYSVMEDEVSTTYFLTEKINPGKRANTQTSNVSLYGTKIYYYINTAMDPHQIRMSDITGMGRVTIQNLAGKVDELSEMFLYSKSSLVMINTKSGKRGLYLFKDNEFYLAQKQEDTPVNIRNLNYDGEYFYHIGGTDSDTAIHRIDKNTFTLEKIMQVPADTNSLSVINNWIYYSTAEHNTIFQVKPGDDKATALN